MNMDESRIITIIIIRGNVGKLFLLLVYGAVAFVKTRSCIIERNCRNTLINIVRVKENFIVIGEGCLLMDK